MHIADPALQPAVVPERLDAAVRLACSDSQAKPSSFNNAHSASNGFFGFRRPVLVVAGLPVLFPSS
jgi:hypothetical protein